MELKNGCYLIKLRVGNGVEYYYKDGTGWFKVSTRGKKFKATSEQVLNHLLPALAGVKPGALATVLHKDVSEAARKTLFNLRLGQNEL